MKTPEIPSQTQQQFRDIRKIQIHDCHLGNSENSVNQSLNDGWQLLLIHVAGERYIFIMGWAGSSKPPQTVKEMGYKHSIG